MKKFFISIGTALVFFVITGVSFAQSYTPLASLPLGPGGTTLASYNLSSYLSGAIKLLVAVAGAIAVIMLIIGGTQYVAAGINPSAKGDAKNRIANALIGLILVLTSYLILRSIDPHLVDLSLTLPPVGSTPIAPSTPPTPTAPHSPVLQSGNTNPSLHPSAPSGAANPISLWSANPVTPPTSQTVIPTAATVDSSNDYSIMRYCIVHPGALCTKADLNHDGKIDSADLMIFAQEGARLDLTGDSKIALGAASTPTSCFFKKNTVDIQGMLPRVDASYDGYGWIYGWGSCGWGNGDVLPPNSPCNGGTWIKASNLGTTCAADMPFGYDYTGTGQYTKFQNWITGASSGNAINLTKLFTDAFFNQSIFSSWMSTGSTGFLDTLLADVTYTTIAQYDLNGDGVADLSTSGADMAKFNSCLGGSASGSCAQADFNSDGVIDNYDLMLWNFMLLKLFAAPAPVFFSGTSGGGLPAATFLNSYAFVPYQWYLNQFESMFFAASKYSDKQILNYCVGHKPFEKCGNADINGSCLAQFNSCGTNMACRTAAMNCKIDATDISNFNTRGTAIDLNNDGKVDLQ